MSATSVSQFFLSPVTIFGNIMGFDHRIWAIWLWSIEYQRVMGFN
jgi:hypothetical protein